MGFLGFKAIPITVRIKSGIMGMPALSECECETYVTNFSLEVLHSQSQTFSSVSACDTIRDGQSTQGNGS